MRTHSRLVILSALALLPACSNKSAAVAGLGDGGATGAGGDASGPIAARCPEGPKPKTDTLVVRVGVVQGQIVDESGRPTSSGLVQVCGKNICVNANVDDSGKLAQAINQDLDAPACKYGDGRSFGKLALPMGGGDTDLGTLTTTVRLPSFDEGMPLKPGETATSAGVSLTLSADAQVEVDALTYETQAESGFRAAVLPTDALAKLDQGFVLGFAVSPVETRICPSPSLTVKNTIELAAGTELELYILGVDVLEEWAPYAGWEKVSEGQVSDDGTILDFPDGVPLLTAFGIRKKP